MAGDHGVRYDSCHEYTPCTPYPLSRTPCRPRSHHGFSLFSPFCPQVQFYDGVVVVVDAKAKWMRVQQGQQQQQLVQPPVSGPYTPRERERRAVTYDLGKDAGRRACGGGDGAGRGAGERMPRDVKDRMKALPRFISILKRGPPSSERGSAAAGAKGSDAREK